MTVSIWLEQPSPAGDPFDLAVIGGGICGVSAALEAQRRGLRVVLFERHGLAWGASGRNAGYLMRGMAENYATARDTLGIERARAVWRWSEENLASLRSLGVESAPGYATRPSCLLAVRDDEAEQLARSHDLLIADGFESELLEPPRETDALWRRAKPMLGLVNPHDAVCHPVELVRSLASRLDADTVRTGLAVGAIEQQAGGCELRTTEGVIRAARVLVCTNAHAGELLPELRGVVTPKRGQMLAARADGVRLQYAYYLNNGDEYLRTGPNGELLMGGARASEPTEQAGEQGGICPEVQRELERWIRRLVTDDFEVTHRWSGTMGFAPEGLPVVGPMPDRPGLWVCAGFTGHGMSLGHLTATRAVAAMLEDQTALPPFQSPVEAAE